MHRVLGWLALAASARAGVIQGVVLEQASGRPLARTVVRLNPVPKSGGTEAQALTTRAGRSGQFVFPAVAPGLYLLVALRDGYFPAAHGQRLPAGRGTPIQVTGDSNFFGELRLRHKGAITGRVLDENGVGTAGVPVVAYRARLPLRSTASRAVSNDRGVFRIFGLDPGKYWVRSAAHTLDDGSGWLPTFGPMGREVREARVHAVMVDGETTDADVSPEPGALFRLRGMIGCDTEGPVTVTLSSETGRRSTQTACRGEYQFEGLAPAGYEVFATLTDGGSSGFTELFLDRDNEAGSVQLMRSPSVDFTVQRAGSRDGAEMTAKVPVTITGRRQDLAETEAVREFTGRRETVAPGHWEFRAKPPAGYYVESIVSLDFTSRRRWKPERAADWFEVFIGPRYGTTIRIAVSDRAGQVMGRVMAEGKPVPGAPVFLWPVAEAARRSLGGSRQLLSDTDGRFRFDSLPPGDYRVVASFDLNEIDEEIAEECRAATVRVDAAQPANVDLAVWMAP